MFWEEISSEKFEELVLDYAEIIEPDLEWIPTPPSGDGNKDGYSQESKKILNFDITSQYWFEAKYNEKCGSISKGQLDPTLVSGYLAGNVQIILFVTNGNFPETYIERAEKFCKGIHCNVRFVDGKELEYWLRHNLSVCKKYFHENNSLSIQSFNIRYAYFISINEFNRGIYSPRKVLENNTQYILSIRVSIFKDAFYTFNISNEKIILIENNKIYLKAGTHNLKLKVFTRKTCSKAKIKILIENDVEKRNYILRDITLYDSFCPRVIHNSQESIKNKLFNVIKQRYGENRNVIYSVIGDGGSGKTHIMNDLEIDIPDFYNYNRIQFVDTPFSNSRYLCHFFMQTNFPSYTEDTKELFDEIINKIQANNIQKKIVLDIQKGVTDSNIAHNVISDIMNHWENDNFTTTTPFYNNTLFFIEDVHKLSGNEARFFTKIINELATRDMRTIIIMTSRLEENMYSEITNLIQSYNIQTISKLTTEEVRNNITHNFNKTIYIDDKKLQGLTVSVLHLIKFLSKIKEVQIGKSDINTLEFNAIVNKLISDFNFENILENEIKKYLPYSSVLDVIFAIGNGFEYNFAITVFDEGDIRLLLEKKIIRYESGYLLPYHDLIYNNYKTIRGKCLYENIGNTIEKLIEYRIDKDNIELYTTLILCEIKYFINHYWYVLDKIKNLINSKKYSSCLLLLKSLIESDYIDNYQIDKYEKLLIYFYYARCLDHCVSTEFALSYYEKVYLMGNGNINDINILCIAYESKAEIFNGRFWLFQRDNYIQDISKFIKILENSKLCYKSIGENQHYVNAYLSSLNRKMVFHYLIDEKQEGEDMYGLCIEKCNEYKKDNYTGYAYMDYARANYIYDIKRSKKLLFNAHQLFISSKNEKRRELISKCDYLFVENIINQKSIDKLINQVIILKQEGYYSEYEKGLMKVAAHLLMAGNTEEAKKYLDTFIMAKKEVHSRTFGILSNLQSAYFFLCDNIDKALEYSELHKKYFMNIGDSYKQIAADNYAFLLQGNKNKKIIWSLDTPNKKNKYFQIECRIW